MDQISELLFRLAAAGETPIMVAALVFVRIGAAAFLLPGFGNQMIPMRVRLAGALALSAVVWPAAYPAVSALPGLEGASGATLLHYMGAEAMIGTLIGMGARFIIMALQLAGSIAAQTTSISQIFGAGVTPDPMPAIGNVLVVSALALAFSQGLHIKVAISLVRSYDVAPPGAFPDPAAVAQWGVERVSGAFALAFGLAAPFVAAAFAYNVALGAINRAMPSLMVAFVGAPAITAGAMLLLIFAGPPMLVYWTGKLDTALADPLGPSP